MPSVFGGNGKVSTPSSGAAYTPTPANAISPTAAGKVAVSIADPSKTLAASGENLSAGFIGLGKGLVSLAENIPVVGVAAKPIIGLVGGIMDATVGRGVSALESIKVGDTNLAQAGVKALEMVGAPLGWGMDLIAAPSRFVEQKVAEARINSTLAGRSDLMTGLFGNAPKQAMDMIRNGSSVEEAALQLADSNAGFSENGAMNLLYSLVLDPVNLIAPGAGKLAAMGKDASHLSRIGVNGLLELSDAAKAAKNAELAIGYANQAAFLEKYGWMGKVYDATLGLASRATKRFSSNIVKEAVYGWMRTYNVNTIDGFLSDISAAGGAVGRELVDKGLKNHAATMMNAIKSGAVRARTAITRSTSNDFADKLIRHAYDTFASGATKEDFLALPTSRGENVGKLLADLKVPQDKIDELLTTIQDLSSKNVRFDEVPRNAKVSQIRDKIAELDSNARVIKDQNVIRKTAEYKANLDARLTSEDAIRVIRESKMDNIPLASNPDVGIPQLAEYIAAGFGVESGLALEIAKSQFAKYSKKVMIAGKEVVQYDVKALTDVISMARGSAFGQAMRELATVRARFRGNKFGRLTITSSRSLTEAESQRLIKVVDGIEADLSAAKAAGDVAAIQKAKDALKSVADSLVNNYDEFGRFAGNAYGYDEIINYLKKGVGLIVKDLTGSDARRIATGTGADFEALRKLQENLAKYGYRLGIAPTEGVGRVTTLVSDHFGRERIVEMVMPFSDTLDHLPDATTQFDLGVLDKAMLTEKMRPTKLSRIWDAATRGYGSEITKNNVIERFVTNMVKKTGISVNQARSIMAKVTTLAAEKGIQPKALFYDRFEVEQIFRDVMGEKYSLLQSAGTDPMKEILSAAAGDWSVAGLTSGFTGRVKAVFPQITLLTDRLYPEVRFGQLNPYFNLILERVETKFMNLVHGIRKENAIDFLDEYRGTVLRRAHLDPRNVSREINDGAEYVRGAAGRNTLVAVRTSPNFLKNVMNATRNLFTGEGARKAFSIKSVKDAKELARDIMTDQFAAREFLDIFEKAAPGKINELAIHYGVTKADDAIRLLLEEYLIQSDPILFAKHVAEQGKIGRSFSVAELTKGGMAAKDAEDLVASVYSAYEMALLKGSRSADKAQYFASHRSWLERSLNHPFLGLYPYSYATQKAIPGMLRFFFLPRYGGIVTPGLNYAKFDQVVEYMNNQTNSNQDILGQLVQNDALLYVFSTILPTTPDAMGFSMPAWLRRGIIQPGLRGDAVTLESLAPTLSEIGATVVRGTALGQVRSTIEGITSVPAVSNANETIGDFIQTTSQEIQQTIQEQVSQVRNP